MLVKGVGCETCRKRRVKCGGESPNCRQCLKANRICYGVAEVSQQLTFVIENPKEGACRSRNVSQPIELLHWSRPASLSPALNVALEDQALALYFHSHYVPPETIEAACEHSKYTQLMWLQAPSNSAFRLAMLATSYATLGNARLNLQAKTISRSTYCRAVRRIKETIQNPAQSCSDQALLATMVLSAFECTNVEPTGELSTVEMESQLKRAFCHHDGAAALLRARQQCAFLDRRSLQIDRTCRRQLLRSALLQRNGLPIWLEDGAAFGESGTSLVLDKGMVAVTQIQSRVEKLAASEHKDGKALNTWRLQVHDVLEKAQHVDHELMACEQHIPANWQYQTHDIVCLPKDDMIYHENVYTYPSQAHAAVWIRHWIVRILLKNAIIKLLSTCSKILNLQHVEEVMVRIRSLIDRICATIPYLTYKTALDEDGNLVLRNIKEVVNKMNSTTVGYLAFTLHGLVNTFSDCEVPILQQQWIRNQMILISRAAGDKLLERIARG